MKEKGVCVGCVGDRWERRREEEEEVGAYKTTGLAVGDLLLSPGQQ